MKRHQRDFFLIATTMSGDKRSLGQRMEGILHRRKMVGLTALLVLAMAALAAACAFGGAEPETPPAEETPPAAAEAGEYSLLGEGISLSLGAREGEFPWGNALDYELLAVKEHSDSWAGLTGHDVDCGGLLLHFVRNQETGEEWLWQARATRDELSTPRGLRVGMSEAELLAAYPEGLYHATTATRPYSSDHFCLYDELYGYGPENRGNCFHLVYYLYEDAITGVELYDLLDGQDFTSPGEETVPEQESDISPTRWAYIGLNTLREYPDPAAAPAEAISQFYDNLALVDWGEMRQLDPSGPGNQGGVMGVLDYLGQQESFTDHQLLAVINAAATGLDGASATHMQAILARHFLADEERFLALMSQATAEAQHTTAFFLAAHLFYEPGPPWDADLTQLDVGQEAMVKLIMDDLTQLDKNMAEQVDVELIWPVEGTVVSGYGWLSRGWHSGICIAAPEGTEVRAAVGGEVISVEEDGGYGITVVIRHDPPVTACTYRQCGEALVSLGDQVEQGDIIATVGGPVDGEINTMLHFELGAYGRNVDPEDYLPRQ